MTPEEVAALLAKLKPQFIHHPECKKLIPAIMREHGIDLDKLYFDVPRMRSAYPKRLPHLGYRLCFPSASRYVVLSAILPVELVATDLSAEA